MNTSDEIIDILNDVYDIRQQIPDQKYVQLCNKLRKLNADIRKLISKNETLTNEVRNYETRLESNVNRHIDNSRDSFVRVLPNDYNVGRFIHNGNNWNIPVREHLSTANEIAHIHGFGHDGVNPRYEHSTIGTYYYQQNTHNHHGRRHTDITRGVL